MPARRVIGVDLGGTKILAGVVDRDGQIHETAERPTIIDSQDVLLDELVALVRSLPLHEIGAVGFGVPAQVDQTAGTASGAVNIPLHALDFRKELGGRIGLPVALENDANAAALAESRLGAGRGARNLVMLTLGTGVGGGVVIDGNLYRGWAELGHTVLVEDGEPCQGSCSGRGHVEAYCSGSAADRLAVRALGPGATAHDLVEQRHPALEELAHHLGVAIGSLVNIFDPELVVIGGGFGAAAFELLEPALRPAIEREALRPAGERLRLARAELGNEAGLIGAALVAFEALAQAPALT